MALRLLGVRHHSPACARRVRDVIRAVRPRYVLIEGPADFTPRMDELLLAHRPPLAIFSYYQDAERSHASWSPLCDYSPEWVAIREGAAAGAEVRFIDLPAWHGAFAGVRNRYGDHERRTAAYVAALCGRLGIDGMDALWDHLFEQPQPADALGERLDAYFTALRADDPGSERDAPREAFMAGGIAHALRVAGDRDVVVVCGGYHVPALARLHRDAAADAWPPTPEPGAGVRHGSYLVSYSFHRLDSFVGYESGMPSPAFYQAVWEEGPEAAADRAMKSAVERLRARKQPVSSADLIAAASMAQGLARLRGHTALARSDLLDGISAALVKDGLDVPLPWSQRGTIAAGTDPVLVEVMRALSGDRSGTLAEGTPRPPLHPDVLAALELHDLVPGPTPRRVVVDLTSPTGLETSRVLHRLRVLGLPGFSRRRGPAWATDPVLVEEWQIARDDDFESRVIEASQYGATLSGAAAGFLSEALLAAGADLARLAALLGEAIFVGIGTLAERVLGEVARHVAAEPQLGVLGAALARVLGVWRHDTLLGAAQAPQLARVIEAAFDRGLWLFEGATGPEAPASHEELGAAIALRDVSKYAAAGGAAGAGSPAPLAGGRYAVEVDRLVGVMTRRAVDASAPPALRGAALGTLWSLGRAGDPGLSREHAARAIRGASRPKTFGDFLAGLFALAREEVLAAPALLQVLDDIFGAMTRDDFLVAVPSLRLAFGFFPPREKDGIARSVVAHHGGDVLDARELRRLEASPATVAAGVALEAALDALEARFGLAAPAAAAEDGS